jgi:mRNA interferase MazF
VKRGEVWTAAGGSDYAGKPRPVVIVQDDRFGETNSITVCLFTTDQAISPLFRVAVEATELNSLRNVSWLMADKLTTLPRDKLGRRIGRLDDATMLRLNRALTVFLGLAS